MRAGSAQFKVDQVYGQGSSIVHGRLSTTKMIVVHIVLAQFEATRQPGHKIERLGVDNIPENCGIADKRDRGHC